VSEPVLILPGEGEVIGDAPHRRVEILSDDETLNATWSRFGPHSVGADLHVHRQHTDLFYVLEGELTVRLGIEDEPVVVPAGMLAHVPPLVVHGFRNGSDAEVRYLNFHTPGRRFADYLRAMRDGRSFSYDQHDPPEDGGRPTSEAVVGRGDVVVERPGLRLELLTDVEELGISETHCEPATMPLDPHVHHRHVESLYVLAGELTFTFGDREERAVAGTWVQVPAGTPHTLVCTGQEEVRFLEIHTPSCGYGDFVRALVNSGADIAQTSTEVDLEFV
jgi:mannose-6-phosphate isomerase-like protein (cupin superfamily)